jgi:predicted DNA-binding transcriptional regulator YafY
VRAGRLVALLLLLQRRGDATAAELAHELEVSVRTIYRDVSSLQAAGVPLWTEPGPRGGVRLLAGWRTTLDGLTADEAGALFLSGAPGPLAELGLGTVLTAAQAKVLSTLPPELQSRATRVRERFLLDAPGWFHHDEPVERLPVLAGAVWGSRRVAVQYGRSAPGARRTLDPLGLVLKGGTWYLVAAHRGRPRTWRVSRVHRAEVLADECRRPTGFALDDYWSSAASEFSGSMLQARVRVRVRPPGLRFLPFLVDADAARRALDAAGAPDEEGWVELDLDVESDEVAAHQLTGLGADVEVLAPPAVRARLAEVGRALAAHHAGVGQRGKTIELGTSSES